jgi:hypothetical protein
MSKGIRFHQKHLGKVILRHRRWRAEESQLRKGNRRFFTPSVVQNDSIRMQTFGASDQGERKISEFLFGVIIY